MNYVACLSGRPVLNDRARMTLVFYRKRAVKNERAWAQCSARFRPLPIQGQRAPARDVPVLAHESGEGTAITKCLGATFLGG